MMAPSVAASAGMTGASHCAFLELPPELRNRLYRFACLELERITVTRQREFRPPVLRINRQVRKESIGIYFSETVFIVDAYDMDLLLIVQMRRLLERYRDPAIRNCYSKLAGQCVWHDLIRGLKAVHDEPLSSLWASTHRGRRWNVVSQGLAFVDEHRDAEWACVDVVLKGMRAGLKLHGSGWV